ncbi:DUF6414 family protein [Mycobacterium colombiense]|uniref:DUF6414 family protein n=1 Tax=Mycobacterium colombiense TaxID=339268 RepID=UPI000AB72D52|nr:hypothetical protein [Mycobacterium colombiense]
MASVSRPAPVHPIYIDTPMLLSFLATLEDGYSMSTSISKKDTQSQQGETTVGGEGGLKNIASLLGLQITLSGQYARKKASESDVEETLVREHTAASMFNKLYGLFKEGGILIRVDQLEGLAALRPGHIVEISGNVKENPIEFLFDTLKQVVPIVAMVQNLQQQQLQAASRQGNPKPAKGAAPKAANQPQLDMTQTAAFIEQLRSDISSGPVTDIVLDAGFCRVIITASREFLTDAGRAALVGGSFTTLGKVTAAGLDQSDSVSIVRRGSLAAFAEIQQRMGSLIQSSRQQFTAEMPDTTIMGPYVQIMPLAIYV